MIDVWADLHVSHLNTDEDKQDYNKANRSERRDFYARNRTHSFVEFEFKISLMAIMLRLFLLHLVIPVCLSANTSNTTRWTRYRPTRIKLKSLFTKVDGKKKNEEKGLYTDMDFFEGNDTVFVFTTNSSKFACFQKQTYAEGNYSSTEYGEFYYINSTRKWYHRKRVFFHVDFEAKKSISVCEETVFLDCHEVKSYNTTITFHVCESGNQSKVFYIRYYIKLQSQ